MKKSHISIIRNQTPKTTHIPFLGSCLLVFTLIAGCKKDNTDTGDDAATESEILADFANVLVNPNYQDIWIKANTLNSAVQTLQENTSQENLTAARNAWRETRSAWEKAEGYLFGPVEDENYDPIMDTWPLNKVELDSLLASNNQLNVSDIEPLPYSLKGFHAIEYMLFGIGGSKRASDLTAREKKYMIALSQSLYNTTTQLRNSWDKNTEGNFTEQLVTAGSKSSRFATRKDAFVAIVTAMAGICDEVANGKMNDPLIARDSTLEESQFSHNSTQDFKNNITGILNAYLCIYTDNGRGLNELVAAKNISLDNTIQSQLNTAITSFNSINANYGAAIFTQQVQIHATQNAINTLKTTLENDLMNFVLQNIKD